MTTPSPNAVPTAGSPVGTVASENALPSLTAMTRIGTLALAPHVERVISNPSAATANVPGV